MSGKKNIPPRIAQRMLLGFLRDDLVEEVTGDLEEKFDDTCNKKSLLRARLNYWYQVIHYLRPFAIRKSRSARINSYGMYNNYLKTTYRNVLRNKLHSFINITGLSIGMAVAITIGFWIRDEVSFNKYHDNYDRIALVVQNVTNNGEVQTWTSVPYPLAEELRKNYGSDFSRIVLTSRTYGHSLAVGEKKVVKPGMYAEPDIAELLTLRMKNGSRDALKDRSTILLSESVASLFFGNDDPLNQLIILDDNITLRVGGVYEDIPFQSEFFEVTFVTAWDLLYAEKGGINTMTDPWRPNSFLVYVQLNEGADILGASERIKDAKLKRVSEALAKKKPELFLFPMEKWHLYSEFKDGQNTGGRIQYAWLFGIIGAFVLLMACINFMNLMTAKSEKRAKEVGIRKAIGSLRGQLITQFFSESVLIAALSFALSLILVRISFPYFNEIAGKQITLLWTSPTFWLWGVGFTIVTGLIAGSYPALYLSSIQSGKALKGAFRAGRSASIPRKVLVVLQFTVSIVLIIGTVVVYEQIQYAKGRPIGYNTSGLVSAQVSRKEIHDHFDAVREELEKTKAIVAMSEAEAPPTEIWGSSSGFEWKGKDPNLSIDFPRLGVTHDYGKTIGWEIKEGRDFSRSFISDSTGLVINEAAAHYMGLTEPVGETIRWFGKPYTILGVVKDLIMGSPYEQVRPTIYFLSDSRGNFVIMKINPELAALEALARIEPVFKKFNPEEPFEYTFADQDYALKFDDEERVGTLVSFFAGLAIFISCLGIFGLASFVAEQRIKEIGIRKVLGASVPNLWGMLSRDFVGLVIVSCLVAIPIAFYFLDGWLQQYQYRTEISWWIFALASMAAIVITLMTVSYQAVRAALINPVNSLKSE